MNRISRCKILMLLLLAGAAFKPGALLGLVQGPGPNRPVPRDEGKNTVGEITEEVARVRLQKLGYSNLQQLTRNGDYWETTATKGGKRVQVRLHVTTGARIEAPASGPGK